MKIAEKVIEMREEKENLHDERKKLTVAFGILLKSIGSYNIQFIFDGYDELMLQISTNSEGLRESQIDEFIDSLKYFKELFKKSYEEIIEEAERIETAVQL